MQETNVEHSVRMYTDDTELQEDTPKRYDVTDLKSLKIGSATHTQFSTVSACIDTRTCGYWQLLMWRAAS